MGDRSQENPLWTPTLLRSQNEIVYGWLRTVSILVVKLGSLPESLSGVYLLEVLRLGMIFT